MTSGNDITITTKSGSSVRGTTGISARAGGTGSVAIRAMGDVTATSGSAIYASTANSGGALSVYIGRDSTITGTSGGYAVKTSGGATTMTIAGKIDGSAGGAIQFDNAGLFTNTLTLHPTADIRGRVNGIPGIGTLRFAGQGSGRFDLDNIDDGSGTAQFQGFQAFAVTGGEWAFTGSTGLAFNLYDGTLKGTGSFGSLTLDGGTIAPGNSIGTIRSGSIWIGSGATYEVEVDAAGNSDRIWTSGGALINGGTVNVIAEDGDYRDSTRYTILTAEGGRTGTFDRVRDNLAFLTPQLSYDANSVYLTLVRTNGPNGVKSFCSVAQSSNQCHVAHALDRFPTTNALFRDVLGQSAAGARQAFDALSGEVHASLGGALINQSRHLRDAVMGRLVQASYGGSVLGAGGPQAATLQTASSESLQTNMMALGYSGEDLTALQPLPANGPTVWSQGFGSWADFDGNGNAAALDSSVGGVVSGLDAEMLPGWRIGMAGGYSYSDLDVDARASSGTVDAYHLLVYGGGELGRVAVRAGGAWSWQEIETSRAVSFPGFYESESASYDGDRSQAFGELAYRLMPGAKLAAEPFAGLAYVHQETDGFSESGSIAGLTSSGYKEDVTYSTLGLRAAADLSLGGLSVSPRVSAAWLHAFDEIDTDMALAFASTGIGFDIQGTPIAQDSALIEAGLDFAVSENATLSIAYDGQFASDADEHGLKGRASWKF